MMKRLRHALLVLALCGATTTPALALDGGTLRINTDNGWRAFEVITQGDNPSGDGVDHSMPGTFDGAGAFLVDSATLRVQTNHETGDASVSEVDLDLGNLQAAIDSTINTGSTGGYNFVIAARQAYNRVSYDGGSSWTNTSSTSNTDFYRFCSSQAYAPDTFGQDRGFVDHIYITGEETGGGALFALDSLGRDFYQLSGVTGSAPGGIGGMPFDAWENAALIDTGETDHVALLLSPDGGTQRMMLYIGEKGRNQSGNSSNSFLARNGLAYGSWYYLNSSLPGGTGSTNNGFFDTTSSGALQASKIEDVDTFPGDPTRVVLGNQNYGAFTFDFDLSFGSSFNVGASSFTVTKIDASGGGCGSHDNVDWTAPTTLGGTAYDDGIIFVNEDNSSGEIWMMRPDGSNQVRVGSTTVSGESTGIFDLSEFVGYAPGSVLITNNQGSPASMTVLINPDAESASTCGDDVCSASENPVDCPADCDDVCPDGFCSGAEGTATCPADCGSQCGDGACNGNEGTTNCVSDCGSQCGDGACNGGESTVNCVSDCGTQCGDGTCNGGEGTTNCTADCGAQCGDGACNGGENSSSCPADCGAVCGDSLCNGSETTATCPGDCGSQCGDGACNGGEGTASCPADCGTDCGDGVCNGGEDSFSCEADCGAPPTGGSYSATGISGAWWSWDYFDFEVPAGMGSLTVTIGGGSGTADLYVNLGDNPDTSNYDCRSTGWGNEQTCTIQNPAAGTWHVGVRGGWFSFSGVDLQADWQ